MSKAKRNQKTFYIHITDMFGDSLNYSYITRFSVKANTERGAVGKVAKETGLRFRNDYDEIYKASSGLTGLVVEADSENGDAEFLSMIEADYGSSFLL